MTAHEYRLVRRNGEREDEEDRMDEPDGLRLWSIILREGARIMTAIITLTAALWIVGKPFMVDLVNEVIDQRRLAQFEKVESLERRIDRNEAIAGGNATSIAKMQTSITTIEELAREQRADTKAILQHLAPPPR